MTCPVCEGKTAVVDSRPQPDCTDRRRECKVCGFRFNTVELDEDMLERLVSHDKDRKD